MYNFITSHQINQEFKKSNLYKVNLGRALSVKENDRRVFKVNDDDVFVKFYLERYGSIIYSQGNIGQINFFVDHNIRGDTIIVFYKEKDFLFDHNPNLLRTKGINGYIGTFIKEIETNYKNEIEEVGDVSVTEEVGDGKNVFNTPGSVSYEDIKKYVSENGPIRNG